MDKIDRVLEHFQKFSGKTTATRDLLMRVYMAWRMTNLTLPMATDYTLQLQLDNELLALTHENSRSVRAVLSGMSLPKLSLFGGPFTFTKLEMELIEINIQTNIATRNEITSTDHNKCYSEPNARYFPAINHTLRDICLLIWHKLAEALNLSGIKQWLSLNAAEQSPPISPTDGTCLWFLECTSFVKWIHFKDNPVFWVQGHPGKSQS